MNCKKFHVVLNCLYRSRIGRLDILWSINKLAGSVTEWTRACAAQHCQLFFQDSDFAGVLEDSESKSRRSFLHFVQLEHLCRPVGCARSKSQTSHSSTESEITSLDADLRMDDFFPLDVWDLVIEVLRMAR